MLLSTVITALFAVAAVLAPAWCAPTIQQANANPCGTGDRGCVNSVDLAIPATSSASPTSVSGYTRQRYIVPALLAEVSASSSGALESAPVPVSSSSAALTIPFESSAASAPTTAVSTPTGTVTAQADPSDGSVLVVTIETTMYVTVTVPPSAATGSAAIPPAVVPTLGASTGFATSAGIIATSSPVVGSAAVSNAVPTLSPTSGVATPVTSSAISSGVLSDSLGVASASIPGAVLSAGSSGNSAIPTTALSDNTGAFGTSSFTGQIESTPSTALFTPTSFGTVTSGFSASATPSLASSVTTVPAPAPTTTSPTQQPVTTFNSSDLAFLLTATVTP